MPVMNRKFQNLYKSVLTKMYATDRINDPVVPEAREAQENRLDLGNVAKIFIIASIVLSLSSQASFLQMAIIISLLLLHFVVGRRRRAAAAGVNVNNLNALMIAINNLNAANQNANPIANPNPNPV